MLASSNPCSFKRSGLIYINPERLKEHGFDDASIEKIEGLVGGAFDLSMVFNRFTFGDDFILNKLGVPGTTLNRPEFDLLSSLGLTRKEIAEANDYVCGTMTIEGAPHMRRAFNGHRSTDIVIGFGDLFTSQTER